MIENKPAIVFIPGLLSNASVWLHQSKYLEEFATIYIANPVQNSGLEMIDSILNMAPDQFALVGHSMGGWLSLEIMKKAEKRVTSLCLLNTTARDDSSEKKAKRIEMIEKVQKGKFSEVVDLLVDCFVYQNQKRDLVRNMFLKMGEETFIYQQQAMLNRDKNVLTSVSCPTLIIHGSQDKNFSLEEQFEIRARIPQAKIAVIEECGHMSPMEMSQAVTALLRMHLFNC